MKAMRRRLCAAALFLAVLLLGASGAGALSLYGSQEVSVAVNEVKAVIVGDRVVSATMADTGVAAVSTTVNMTVYIYGRKAGSTTLHVVTDAETYEIPVEVTGSVNASTTDVVELYAGGSASFLYYKIESCTTSDAAVATAYSDGTSLTVTGKAVGTAYITVQYMESDTGIRVRDTLEVRVRSNRATTYKLAEGESALTDSYYAVTGLRTTDDAVAVASRDASGRVVLCAVGTGSTAVTYRYKRTYNSGWLTATLHVTVTGAEARADMGAGLLFGSSFKTVALGKSYTLKKITMNGNPIEASALLWSSTDVSVLTVDANTGKFKAVGKGTAYLVAVTKEGDSVNRIGITVA